MQAAYDQFRQADYIATLETLRTILENETNPGEAELLAAHALFGLEAYREAAGALRAALRALSEDRWGEIVSNHRDYFASSAEYDQRLRALERHVARNPRDPSARFLLGYHYGYRGRTADAMAELQTAVALDRNDSLAAELLEAVRSERTGDAGAAEAEQEQGAPAGEPDAAAERPEAIDGPAFPAGREF
jgi:thioredoxin-like negative regulator of GroEL